MLHVVKLEQVFRQTGIKGIAQCQGVMTKAYTTMRKYDSIYTGLIVEHEHI